MKIKHNQMLPLIVPLLSLLLLNPVGSICVRRSNRETDFKSLNSPKHITTTSSSSSSTSESDSVPPPPPESESPPSSYNNAVPPPPPPPEATPPPPEAVPPPPPPQEATPPPPEEVHSSPSSGHEESQATPSPSEEETSSPSSDSHETTPSPTDDGQATDAPDPSFALDLGGVVGGLGLDGICHKTDYPDLCLSSLKPISRGIDIHKPNTLSLLELAIKAAVEETKSVIKQAEKLMSEKSGDTSTASSLKDCRDNYSDALDNYQSAMDAIPDKDIGTINSMLSAASTDFSTCDDEFLGSNPLVDLDAKLSHMASNCLAIAALVKF